MKWWLPVVLCACLPQSASAAPKVPVEHEGLPKLRLGLALKNFLVEFSAEELATDEKGIRRFDVNENTLPENVGRMLCEFSGGKLVFVEAAFTAGHAESISWSAFTAKSVKKLGTPKTWTDLAGVRVTQTATLTDSAAWMDASGVLAYGRASENGKDIYVLVLAEAARFKVVAAALAERVEQETAAAKDRAEREAAAVKEAERLRLEREKRESADAKSKREREQAEEEWIGATIAYWSAVRTGTAADIRKMAERARRAGASMQALGLLTSEQQEEVERYAKRVKDLADLKTATIHARGDWQETGLKVSSDVLVFVRLSSGQVWSVSSNWGECGPEGYPPERDKSKSYRVAGSYPSGALICDTGKGSGVYYVPAPIALEVKTGSVLRCRINDTDVSNNSGAIQIEAVTVPAGDVPLADVGK